MKVQALRAALASALLCSFVALAGQDRALYAPGGGAGQGGVVRSLLVLGPTLMAGVKVAASTRAPTAARPGPLRTMAWATNSCAGLRRRTARRSCMRPPMAAGFLQDHGRRRQLVREQYRPQLHVHQRHQCHQQRAQRRQDLPVGRVPGSERRLQLDRPGCLVDPDRIRNDAQHHDGNFPRR